MENKLVVAIRHLRKADPVIDRLIARHGPCTLYNDNSLIHQSKFHVLAWAIINQQLSVKSAQSIENKLLTKLSSRRFEPHAILALKKQELSACGLSRQKIRYLRTLSKLVQARQLMLEDLNDKTNDAISEILTEIPGIGPWTVDMFLIFSMGRLDVLPLGDLALRKSLALHYHLPDKAALNEYQAIAQTWHPYQTIASWYLWLAVD
jgi:DNA-3-methyladenine glycosylase II